MKAKFVHMLRCGLTLSVVALLVVPLRAQVVINEIYYHAPEDLNDLQWIEFHNPTDQQISLKGWKVAKGVKFEFKDSTIAPRGYVVICKDRKKFHEFYDMTVAGEFEKSLKRSGDKIALLNSEGAVVDTVSYGHDFPWPRAADGESPSLERISPTAYGDLADNWASSPWSDDGKTPAGTPGAQNHSFSASLPPIIRDPTGRVEPGQSLRVQAIVRDAVGLRDVTLRYVLAGPGFIGTEISVPMVESNETFAASIPAQTNGSLVRFRIHAVNQKGAGRYFPAEHEPQPAISCWVHAAIVPGKIPLGFFINTDAEQMRTLANQRRNESGVMNPFSPAMRNRMTVERQFESGSDLAALWATLTLSNSSDSPSSKLQSVFRSAEIERLQLQRRTLEATNMEQTINDLPRIVGEFKAKLGDALNPQLAKHQMLIVADWIARTPARDRGFGMPNTPATLLRNFLPLERSYFFLSTKTNTGAADLAKIRDIYQEAILSRDALTNEAAQLMGPPGGNRNDGRDELENKMGAINSSVEKNLRASLKPHYTREMIAWRAQQSGAFGRRKTPKDLPGKSAFVLIDPETEKVRVFDFVQITERSGGHKVRLGKGQQLEGNSVVNIVFDNVPRRLLNEPLSYEFHRRVGNPVYFSSYVRLSIDGDLIGYHYLFGQPNNRFLKANGLNESGNLFKAYWMGRGLAGRHVKKSNSLTGHDDLIKLVEELERSKSDPEAQWQLMQREFDISHLVNHYAARLLLSDWDGFFNNYFLFHDTGGKKKWLLFAWDQDKTWGDYDGNAENKLLYDLPLSYGSENDARPISGGAGWWRSGGYISKPVLANPQFRTRYLSRIRELLETEFTEAKLFPLIDQYGDRLREEVDLRASATGRDPVRSRQEFESNLASLKEFVTKRRGWLLAQDEIHNAGSSPQK